MCRKLFCLVIFVLVLGLVSNTWADLVAHWPLDIDFLDDSGNNFHGIPMGGASLITDAERDQVLSLDGNDDFVDCGNPTDPCALDFGTGNWTVSAWVKTTMRGTGDENKGVIYAKGGDHGGGHRYGLYVNENQDPQGRATLITDDNVNKVMVNSSVLVNDGEWHHIIAEVDRAAGEINIYVDGAPANGEQSGELVEGASLSNGADFTVGMALGADGGEAHFAGSLDFLRVSRGTLADAETTIEELYAWEFDGPFLRDFSGNLPTGEGRDVGAVEYLAAP